MHKRVTGVIVLIFFIGVFCYGCQTDEIAKIEENKEKAPVSETGEAGSQGSEAGIEDLGALQYCVYVCGQVQEAGVYRLRAGSRVIDAITAAGGFTDQAAKEFWNLAEPVYDGQRIYVPDMTEIKEQPPDSSMNTENGAFLSDGRLDINRATVADFMTLPGIGEKRAGDIVNYRKEYGSFSKIEDIKNVAGIKDSVFEKIKNLIAVR